MALRLAAPALAASVVALSLGGARGAASLVLLVAIVAVSARLIIAVGDAAQGRGDRWPVVTAAGAIVCLVAAGAAHVPLLAVGALACAALELVAPPAARPDAVVEQVAPVEVPASRAA